jgi:hypothetical protein
VGGGAREERELELERDARSIDRPILYRCEVCDSESGGGGGGRGDVGMYVILLCLTLLYFSLPLIFR